MSLIQLINELEHQIKHMPGRHDQKRHAPKQHAAGTPVTREWLDSPDNEHLFRELKWVDRASGLDRKGSYEELVKGALVKYGVTQEDLKGLEKFTVDPPNGYRYDSAGKMYDEDDGHTVQGVYTQGVVHLSTSIMYDRHGFHVGIRPSAERIVMHELGHHVSSVKRIGLGRAMARDRAARDVIEANRLRNMSSEQLAEAGLRRYSLTTGEFLADSYKVMRMGTDSQREVLDELWVMSNAERIGLEDALKEVAGVSEIRTVSVGSDVVEVRLFPAEVDHSLIQATPWYYIEEGNGYSSTS